MIARLPTSLAPPKRILVVGWGFLGAAIGTRLLSDGLGVVAITPTASSRTAAGVLKGVEIVFGRAEEPGLLDRYLPLVDHVVYAGGGLLPAEAASEPLRDATQMILPFVATLQALSHYPHLGMTYISSGGTVYGNPAHLPVHEEAAAEPISPYGASRLACTIYAQMHARTQANMIQIARCANVYGPDQPHDRSQGAVAVFLHCLANDLPITIYGNGTAVRDYIYIDDVTAVISHLVRERVPVEIINVGTGLGYSNRELLEIISQITGRSATVHRSPPRPHDVDAIVLDVSRLHSLMEYRPISLREGLRKVWDSLNDETGHLASNG